MDWQIDAYGYFLAHHCWTRGLVASTILERIKIKVNTLKIKSMILLPICFKHYQKAEYTVPYIQIRIKSFHFVQSFCTLSLSLSLNTVQKCPPFCAHPH